MTTGLLRFRHTSPDLPEPEWVFLAGSRFFVALPAATAAATIDAFAELIGHPAVSAEALVARLPAGDQESPFAIVTVHPERVDEEIVTETTITAVVRGGVAVDIFSVGGWRRFTDQGARPWMLADFRSVTAVVVGGTQCPMVALDESLRGSVAGAGVQRAAQLIWALAPMAQEPEAALPIDDTPDDDTPDEDDSGQVRDGADETLLSVSRPSPPSAPAWPPTPEPPGGSEEDAAVETPLPTFYRFRIGNAPAIALETDAYIGRKPRIPRVPSTAMAQLVPVASPRREVSGTHVKIAQEGGMVVVTDLGSLNGTIVSIPGSRAVRLRHAESVVVTPGTRLDIGDGNIIEILSIVP